MTEIPSGAVAASGALAGAAPAAMSGLPPHEVIVWALLGGVVSVWLSRRTDAPPSLGQAAGILGQICVSAASGIALSALLLAIAPGYSWLAPMAAVPRWALAGAIAALIFKVGPFLLAIAQKRLAGGDKNGG